MRYNNIIPNLSTSHRAALCCPTLYNLSGSVGEWPRGNVGQESTLYGRRVSVGIHTPDNCNGSPFCRKGYNLIYLEYPITDGLGQ